MAAGKYYIDALEIDPLASRYSISGRSICDNSVNIHVIDENGNELPFTNHVLGSAGSFYIQLNDISSKKIILIIEYAGLETRFKIGTGKVAATINQCMKLPRKGYVYLQEKGIKAFFLKTANKFIKMPHRKVKYNKWLSKHLPTQLELDLQRDVAFSYSPKFSIIVPLYKTPIPYLEEMVESIKNQTYKNWELCLSDGSGEHSPLTDYLRNCEEDKRIKVLCHQSALRISDNTNAALDVATGDFIVFVDHDDILVGNALYECVKVINDDPETEVLYSDEDKMSMDGRRFFQPHMKPDFNIDLLRTVNYISHLFVVKRKLINYIGVLREEYDGAQDYDFIFRCVEKAKKIYHIPQILYHWRSHDDSTAENPKNKLYAFEAGRRAVQSHYERMGINADVLHGEYLGLYQTKFIREKDPFISIIIPNKDHVEDLSRCISSIEKKSTYKKYEYVIIENNSVHKETFDYYKELEAKIPGTKIIHYGGDFNYSAINNYGVKYAEGEYLLFLNNDIEIINEECLEQLLGHCMRKEVGAVGARLYYGDNTIQHAGVIIGIGGVAGHAFVRQRGDETGYCHRIICAQDYSAVTAACMMVTREDFEITGGFNEDLKIAFNDIDFCLKLRELGKLIVYNPYAELYHYESKSRGPEDTKDKVRRFNLEIDIFKKRWGKILDNGDPFYSPNLTLDRQDFSLRRIAKKTKQLQHK